MFLSGKLLTVRTVLHCQGHKRRSSPLAKTPLPVLLPAVPEGQPFVNQKFGEQAETVILLAHCYALVAQVYHVGILFFVQQHIGKVK